MTFKYTIVSESTVGNKAVTKKAFSELNVAITSGFFEEEFNLLEKSALRNNLSEEEAYNLIENVRDKLPINK